MATDISQIAALKVSQNITYYVSTGGSDATGDGTLSKPYATPHKILDLLKGSWINDDVLITIQLLDGTYTFTQGMFIRHPCGSKIVIQGQTTYTKLISNIISSSGSSKNFSVVVQLNNIDNIAINDYAIIRGAINGTNSEYLNGCHKVTAIDAVNKTITVNTSHLKGAPSGSVATSLCVILKTICNFTNCSAFTIQKGLDLGGISKMALIGNAYMGTYAIRLNYGSALHSCVNLGVSNFRIGISVTYGSKFVGSDTSTEFSAVSKCIDSGVMVSENSYMNANYMSVSGITGGSGVDLTVGGVMRAASLVSTGNAISGVNCTINSMLYASQAIFSGNAGSGLYSGSNSTALAGSSQANNNVNGYYAEFSGEIECTSSKVLGNTTNGYYANSCGYIRSTGAGDMGGNANLRSPLANTVGNKNAYIEV